MDWQLAIERNQKALVAVVAGLIAMARQSDSLPRPLHRSILRILRPAESALRRLIVIVAALAQTASHLRGSEGRVEARDSTQRGKQSAADWVGGTRKLDKDKSTKQAVDSSESKDPHPDQLRLTRFSDLPSRGRLGTVRPLPDFSTFPRHETLPAFNLIDPRKRFGETGQFSGLARAVPRISVPGVFDPARPTRANDALDAAALLRRLRKLQYALSTLPRQARRLIRLMAKRSKAGPGPGKVGPIRPGHPPGHRKRPRHEVDGILRDCHWLALECGRKPP